MENDELDENLDLTPNRIKKNDRNKKAKTFNPDITMRQNWEGTIRLFAKEKGHKTRRKKENNRETSPAYREEPGEGKIEILMSIIRKEKDKLNKKIIVVIRHKNKVTKVGHVTS